MPKWIHDRADHIRSKNPGMSQSQSFAIATQQAYAAGKAPSGYGTAEGRVKADKKYRQPASEYKKTADPKSKSKESMMPLEMVLGFADEFQKIAAEIAMNSSTSRATGASQVMKPALAGGSTPKLPKLVAKQRETPEASQVQDHLSSMKANPPPPVTMSFGG